MIKLLILRSRKPIRKNRVVTALVHARTIHSAATTISLIGDSYLDRLPHGRDSRVLIHRDLTASSNRLAVNLPVIKLLILRSRKPIRKNFVRQALIHLGAGHSATTTISVI